MGQLPHYCTKTTDSSPASTQNLAANQVTYLCLLKQEKLSTDWTLAPTFTNSICFESNYYVSVLLMFLSASYSPTITWKKYIPELIKCNLCLINTNCKFLSRRTYGQVWKDFPQISLKSLLKKNHFPHRWFWHGYNQY